MGFKPHNLSQLSTRLNGKGYVMARYLEHPSVQCDGYIRYHRLVMENVLGRYLEKGEIVHHQDENRQNNEESNLELLASNREHRSQHRGKPPTRICVYCGATFTVLTRVGNKYSRQKCCSQDCSQALRCEKSASNWKNQNKRTPERPTKDVLEKLVWEIPAVQIGERYNVSSNTVLNWFKLYEIADRPSRGYWRKRRTRK